ncbi:MAG: Lrp/AsnC family transcriptional regulator [Vibrio sp.]
MNNDQLDHHDVKILTLLQENGRLTSQELSDLVGLSASQCSRRRIHLEQYQFILGYQARLSPAALKQEVVAMIEVKLVSHEENNVQRFIDYMCQESTIFDAYKTTGDGDYSLRCVVSDLPNLNELINRIFNTKLIAHIKTSVILDRVKENGIVI